MRPQQHFEKSIHGIRVQTLVCRADKGRRHDGEHQSDNRNPLIRLWQSGRGDAHRT